MSGPSRGRGLANNGSRPSSGKERVTELVKEETGAATSPGSNGSATDNKEVVAAAAVADRQSTAEDVAGRERTSHCKTSVNGVGATTTTVVTNAEVNGNKDILPVDNDDSLAVVDRNDALPQRTNRRKAAAKRNDESAASVAKDSLPVDNGLITELANGTDQSVLAV